MDDPAIQPLAKAFVGRSLLRGGSPPTMSVVLSNCTELWACAFRNWGAMQGTRKLVGTQADHAWSCFDVKDDPEERVELGPEACSDLAALAEAGQKGRPF
jgi:hypothetical protein